MSEQVDWEAYRAKFPVTESCVYLNTGWSGPSSRDVVDAMHKRLEREAFGGPAMPEIRHEKALLVQETRASLARLIGADDVALQSTTTEGLNVIAHGIDIGPGDEVVTTNMEHGSPIIVCYDLRRRTGCELTIVRSSAEESFDELARMFEEAITPRTKLVLLSHISYNRGTRLPVERIIAAAHAAGARVLLDGAQPVGQIAVDVRALDVDYYAFSAHKYLLGPDGAGALYIRPDLVESMPPLEIAHGGSEWYDFEGHWTPRDNTMRKFEVTTHSGPLLAGVSAAAELLESTGIEAIEERLLALSSRLVDGLQRLPNVRVRSPLDPRLRSALVTFTIGDLEPNETCAALWQLRRVAGRVVNDKRVRLSIAPFNNEADIDVALEAIEYIATRGLPEGAMSAEEYKALIAEDDD